MQVWAYAIFGRGANLTGPLSQSKATADSGEGEWLSPLYRDWPTTANIRTKNRRRLSATGTTASVVESTHRKAINCVCVDTTAPLAARGAEGK